MGLDRDLMKAVRRLDEYDLRRLLMFAGGVLEARTGEPPSTRAAPAPTTAPGPLAPVGRRESFRQQFVRCGKPGCTRCPHGPYWYAYWREDGRSRSRYVGRDLPSDP